MMQKIEMAGAIGVFFCQAEQQRNFTQSNRDLQQAKKSLGVQNGKHLCIMHIVVTPLGGYVYADFFLSYSPRVFEKKMRVRPINRTKHAFRMLNGAKISSLPSGTHSFFFQPQDLTRKFFARISYPHMFLFLLQ